MPISTELLKFVDIKTSKKKGLIKAKMTFQFL